MTRSLYSEPVVEVVELEMEDIICTSGNEGDNESPWALEKADFSITE